MIGIVYATRREADPFLVQSAARPLAERPLTLFRTYGNGSVDSIVAVSGMGKVAAALAATHLVLTFPTAMLINAGICGCLSRIPQWPVGQLFRISQAVEGDCDRMGRREAALACPSGWFGQLSAARLVTCDRPVFQADWRDELSALGDLADMEGAAVARVAHRYDLPWALIKGISDRADASGRNDIEHHIDGLSVAIATTLMQELSIHHDDTDP